MWSGYRAIEPFQILRRSAYAGSPRSTSSPWKPIRSALSAALSSLTPVAITPIPRLPQSRATSLPRDQAPKTRLGEVDVRAQLTPEDPGETLDLGPQSSSLHRAGFLKPFDDDPVAGQQPCPSND